jgi:hypothetical protein
LTYKSIRDAIKAHDGRELFCLPHLVLGEEMPRTVFISKELAEIVIPPWPKTWEGRRHARLRALLDEFTDGSFITIAENPHDKEARAILARVDPVEAEIFDFRCLDPQPGIRAFGCFAETDTFVVLTWNYRENLENDDDWTAGIAQCESEWNRLFGGLQPFKGTTLNEYVSYNFRAV